MSLAAEQIIEHLGHVAAERHHRLQVPGLYARVVAIKRYQQRRFEATYADLLASSRYALAARFFLDELYGPQDFTARDAQFQRVVPALVKLFPAEVVETVRELAELHHLSERLDTRMGTQVAISDTAEVGARTYVQAWQACGQVELRERQVALTVRLGESLDRLTRKAVLRHGLRMMRGPAKAAGLAELQKLLESGFDAFRSMDGAKEFLRTVADRERGLAQAMFELALEEGHTIKSDAAMRGAIPGLV